MLNVVFLNNENQPKASMKLSNLHIGVNEGYFTISKVMNQNNEETPLFAIERDKEDERSKSFFNYVWNAKGLSRYHTVTLKESGFLVGTDIRMYKIVPDLEYWNVK